MSPTPMVKPPPLAQATRLKLLVLGPAGCGKSTLLRAVQGLSGAPAAPDAPGPTLGVDLVTAVRQVGREAVHLNFFDLSGDPLYREVRAEFYREQGGALLCLDLAARDARAALQALVDEGAAELAALPRYLLGLRADAAPAGAERELEVLAQRLGARAFACSARTGQGVAEALDYII